FVRTVDLTFGPITTLRGGPGGTKKIPWTAFQMSPNDWVQVQLCSKILWDAHRYHQICSLTRTLTLHQVIPIIETLASRWEDKAKDPVFTIFHDALTYGLEKLNKYYKRLDNTDSYILALFAHPYFQLDYIELNWGGEKEYREDIANRVPNLRNWQAHATKVVEDAVRATPSCLRVLRLTVDASAAPGDPGQGPLDGDNDNDEYDRARRAKRRQGNEGEDAWRAELKRYLSHPMSDDITKFMDTLDWWTVCTHAHPCFSTDRVLFYWYRNRNMPQCIRQWPGLPSTSLRSRPRL
ncbi:hypothetical protein C8Q80DRAFT_1108172, partial [Daedaleopsis nitida]